jgi:hypothetical protein
MPTCRPLLVSLAVALCLGLAGCMESGASPTVTGSTGLPVLGGPGSAFIAAYGPLTKQSNQATGDLHFRQYPGVAQDFLVVDLGVFDGFTQGAQDADSLDASAPPGQPWSSSTARAMCAVFFPSDAHEVKQVTVIQSGAVVGLDVVYHSATLATVFAASDFQDVLQAQVPPGTFDVSYLYTTKNDPNAISDCQLLIGNQQTVILRN